MSKTAILSYASVSYFRDYVSRKTGLILSMIALLAAIVLAPNVRNFFRLRLMVGRCISYRYIPGRIIFDDSESGITTLRSSPSYVERRYPWNHVESLTSPWKDVSGSAAPVAALGHVMMSGSERLVAVELRPTESNAGIDPAERLVELHAYIVPANTSVATRDRQTAGVLKLFIPVDTWVRVFEGNVVSTTNSISIRVDMRPRTMTVYGYIRPDGSITFNTSDGQVSNIGPDQVWRVSLK